MKKMRNSQLQVWEEVREFYSDKFGIENELVDLMSDFQILKLCATGASNSSISAFLDIELDDVKHTIGRHTSFYSGWDDNLPFNPLKLYESTMDDRPDIKDLIQQFNMGVDDLTKAFRIAELVYNLERTLDEKWI